MLRSRHLFLLAILPTLAIAVACGDDSSEEDPTADSGTSDATNDLGTKVDASTEEDSGSKSDASVKDSSQPDTRDAMSDCALCAANATCGVDGGLAVCTCPAGFAGDALKSGTGCSDVDECAGTNDCVADGAGGVCANNAGSYACSCKSGYTGDGKTGGTGCSDVDECAGTNDCVADGAGGVCANNAGSYACSCKSGYTGDGKTGGTGCSDVDECAGANDCSPLATCGNTVGAYTCTCGAALVGNGFKSGTGCKLSPPELLWYRFDGAGSSVPNQASAPPTATATIMGAQTQGGTGQCNGTLIGSGNASTTDYVDTGWATSLSGSWTLSFWTADSNPTTSTLYYILGDVSAAGLRCFTNGVAGTNNWILRGGGLNDVLVNGGATAAAHVTTFVYDATVPEVRAYLDGVLANTVAQPAVTPSGAGPFKVGGYSSNVGLAPNGRMDEFRLYNRALPLAEVQRLSETAAVCQ